MSVVVTGTGGIGIACARRLGSGRSLVLAESDRDRLDEVLATLRDEGFDAHGLQVDVSDRESVAALARFSSEIGPLEILVHTAGLSPTMGSGQRILSANLLGSALVIDQFGESVVEGSVGVCIASMAGHLLPMAPETEAAIATAPSEGVISATGLDEGVDSSTAYAVSKRGVQLRVVAAASAWGARGGRILSISPGMIATPMGHRESAAQSFMGEMLERSPVPRLGTPAEIADAVAWLAGPDATFLTGTDLLIDGGVVASLRGWS